MANFSLRGVTTYPNRSEHSFRGLGELVRKRKSLKVTEVGPGFAWKRTAHLLPPKGTKRTTPHLYVRDAIIKLVDRAGRRLFANHGGLVTFEPFELVRELESSLGPKADFSISVMDKYSFTSDAFLNHPDFKRVGKHLNFILGDIQTQRLPASDVVVAQQALWYTNRKKALGNIVQSLKKNGLLVSNELTADELSSFGLKLIRDTPDGQIYQKL